CRFLSRLGCLYCLFFIPSFLKIFIEKPFFRLRLCLRRGCRSSVKKLRMRGRTLQAFFLFLRGMTLCVFASFLIVTISPDCTSLGDNFRFVRTLHRRIFPFYFMDLPVDVDSGG